MTSEGMTKEPLPTQPTQEGLSRRCFLKAIHSFFIATPLLATTKALTPGSSPSLTIIRPTPKPFKAPEKKLTFYNIHTGEWVKKCVFWADGKYQKEGIQELSKLFRDHRTNQHHSIDAALFQLIHEFCQVMDTNHAPLHLISGYRSPCTNKKLRQASHGVAKNSFHMYGKAADIYLEGYTTRELTKAARSLKKGGVGGYSQFIHMDTGPLRHWGV